MEMSDIPIDLDLLLLMIHFLATLTIIYTLQKLEYTIADSEAHPDESLSFEKIRRDRNCCLKTTSPTKKSSTGSR